MMQTILNVSSR